MSQNQLQVINIEDYAMTAETIQKQVNTIQNVMHQVMKQGDHYGVIPGCGTKPTLLKPGAEKLSVTFRLAPSYDIRKTDLPGGHREYEVVCTLTHMSSGIVVGQGVGSCSTMEGKYRFRNAEPEITETPVPKKYWDLKKGNRLAEAQELIGGKGFVPKKTEMGWMIAKLTGDRVEHDNPADYYNTVLKMSKKRAHVDAVLTATAASDIFTQDIEDMTEVFGSAPISQTETKPENGNGDTGKKGNKLPTPARKMTDALRSKGLKDEDIASLAAFLKTMNPNGVLQEDVMIAVSERPEAYINEWRQQLEDDIPL